MAPRFTEREPYERGFGEVFDRDIAPRLDDLEAERVDRFTKRKVRLKITFVGCAILAVAGFVIGLNIWHSLHGRTLFAGVFVLAFPTFIAAGIAAGIGWWWAGKLQYGHQEAFREILIGPICTFLGGLVYDREPGDRFDHKRFTSLGITKSGAFGRCEDLFIGRYRDTGFKMIDAKVVQQGENSSTTVFDGLLFEIDVPTNFAGSTIISRDIGSVGNALKGFFKDKFGTQERVKFQDAAFEERFAVYATDPTEAYTLVSPSFCRTMLALAEIYADKSLGAAFVDGVFLLAVPVAGDLFEPGSVAHSVYDCEDDIHAFLEEVSIAHRVIDILHGEGP